jgi:hypothetical protein
VHVRSYIVQQVQRWRALDLAHIAMPVRVPTSGTNGGDPAMGPRPSASGLFGPRSEQPSQADILKKEAFRLVSCRYL